MKILYIITKSNWGGAQRHVYDMAKAMKDKGHTAIVALGGDGLLRRNLEDIGIRTYPISTLARDMKPKHDMGSLREIFAIIKRENPDVLHLHSPKAGGLGAVAGRILKVKKIIYTVHGWAFNEHRPIFEKAIIALFSWFTILLSHRIVLLSEREYAQTLHFPFAKGKLALIPLGIRSQVFVSIGGSRQFMAEKTGTNIVELNKRTIIGVIAELHPNKGLHYLINALEQVSREHKDILCIIIGDGEDRVRLQKEIDIKKLESFVKLIGYVDEASQYLKAFNIFILPSLKEGLPYVLLEAGLASLPVIATTVGGIPEIVEDMKSGVLVRPRNGKELAHAISFMIEHPRIRKEYGSTLRESVIKNFAFESMVEKTEKTYRE